MNVGDKVTFNQGDENNTMLTGIVSRVWPAPSDDLITVKVPGRIAGTVRTFVRHVNTVHKV
jgi:hypothetical protein